MNRTAALFFFFFLSLSIGAGAADLILDDFDGVVEVRAGSGWKGLDLGSRVAADSTIRISGGGLAEFRDGALRIHVVRDGTYQLSVLTAKAKALPPVSAIDVVADRAARLLGAQENRRPTVAAGVRGDLQDPGAALVWAEEDEDSLPGSAMDRLHKAEALAREGKAAAALRQALGAEVPASSPLFAAALLLISTQGLAVQEFDLVASQAQRGRAAALDPDVVQDLELMEALAYRGQGDEAKARGLLSRLAREAPESGAGREAARLLRP